MNQNEDLNQKILNYAYQQFKIKEEEIDEKNNRYKKITQFNYSSSSEEEEEESEETEKKNNNLKIGYYKLKRSKKIKLENFLQKKIDSKR